MKHLLLVLALTLVGNMCLGQNFDYALNKTEQSEYTSPTRIMTVYQFVSDVAIPYEKKFEIIKSLELKREIKTAQFDQTNTTLTVEVVKGITVDDLNNVLNEYAVLLVTEKTPKALIDKFQHQTSTH